MGKYDQEILDAEEDIREAGELASFYLPGGTVEDEDQPWKETEVPPTIWNNVPICYIPDGSAEWRAYVNGTDMPKGATLALVPANIGFEIKQEMWVDSPSRGKLRINSFDKLAPGEQVIMYTLKLIQ